MTFIKINVGFKGKVIGFTPPKLQDLCLLEKISRTWTLFMFAVASSLDRWLPIATRDPD